MQWKIKLLRKFCSLPFHNNLLSIACLLKTTPSNPPLSLQSPPMLCGNFHRTESERMCRSECKYSNDISLHFPIHIFYDSRRSFLLSLDPEVFYDRFLWHFKMQQQTLELLNLVSVCSEIPSWFFCHSSSIQYVFYLVFSWMRFAINNVIKASESGSTAELLEFNCFWYCWMHMMLFLRNCRCRVSTHRGQIWGFEHFDIWS